jgi:hypothetical protein
MNECRSARRHDQACIQGARESGDSAFNLADIAHPDRAQLDAERRRDGLDCGKMRGSNRKIPRGDFFEQFQPFRGEAEFIRGKNPVVFPPGRAKLSTKPIAIGSPTLAKTIGMVRLTWRSA